MLSDSKLETVNFLPQKNAILTKYKSFQELAYFGKFEGISRKKIFFGLLEKYAGLMSR